MSLRPRMTSPQAAGSAAIVTDFPPRPGPRSRHFRGVSETWGAAESCRIAYEMVGLPLARMFPGEPEPSQVLVDRGFVFGSAPRRVDVLDPQQETPVGPGRHVEIQDGRQRMAQMKIAVRARCK